METKQIRTRWQLRVDPELEILIRNYARSNHRSINQTVIVILEKHFGITRTDPPPDLGFPGRNNQEPSAKSKN